MAAENALFNKYSLVKGAARRARQLQSGAPQLVAQDEIAAGFVTFVLPEKLVEPNIDHPVR